MSPTNTPPEQAYYEIEAFWEPESITALDNNRVSTLIDHIPFAVRSILDVGCGGGIFLNSLAKGTRKFDRLCGVDRSAAALKYVETEKRQHSIEALPFNDDEFDLVASLEVIEHLPQRIYKKALGEIARIAQRYIMISVPYSQDLDESLCCCPACRTRYEPNYHMRSFDKSSLAELFAGYGYDCVDFIPIHKTYRLKWRKLFMVHNGACINPPPWFAVCPVCGLRGSMIRPQTSEEPCSDKPKNYFKELIRSMWPKEVTYTWIAAVFQTRGGK